MTVRANDTPHEWDDRRLITPEIQNICQKKLQNADIASGGVFRELSEETRNKIIDLRIEDIAFRHLLKIMLKD
jgi:hypothetical protein